MRIQVADVQASAVQSIPVPSVASGATVPPLLAETLGANLNRMTETSPRSSALVDEAQGVRLTYQGLWREVGRVSRALMAEGVEPGDRVGILAPNRFEWVLLQFAVARIGAILVGLDPGYRTAELEFALRHSGTQYLFAASVFRQRDLVARVLRIRDRCPELEQVIILEDGWHRLLRFSRRVSKDDLYRRERTQHPLNPVSIQFTAGADGRVLAVTMSHQNLLNAGFLVGERLGYGRGDRICLSEPLHRCSGMALGMLAGTSHQACLVLPRRAGVAAQVARSLVRERCTSLHAPGELFLGLLSERVSVELVKAPLRTGLLAGTISSPRAPGEIKERLGLSEFAHIFGMAEAGLIACRSEFPETGPSRSVDPRSHRFDRVAPHTEIRIVDPGSGEVLPCGRTGELRVRGYGVMLGYWIDPITTISTVESDGWLHTGVTASLDAQGRIRLVDTP